MKTRKILAHYSCMPSARRLRDSLQNLTEGEIKILVTSNNNKVIKKDSLIIRYGNSNNVIVGETIANSSEFISLCSNKLIFSELLNSNGILSPKYFRRSKPKKYPIIIRTTMNSMGARGIYVIEDEQEFKDMWSPRFWWTKFYHTNFEIRAHVFLHENGNITIPRIFRKSGMDSSRPIRNNTDYRFLLKRVSRYKKAMPVIQAVAILMKRRGGKFFALDMGYSPKNKTYVVFEANSAPGLNENTADIYANFLYNEGVLK